jgi:acylphosphatase
MVSGNDSARLTLWLRGRVQGVGMRWWVRAQALERGLVGSATNLADGRVEVVAQGSRGALEDFERIVRSGTSPGSITGVVTRWGEVREGLAGFVER